VNSDSHYHAGVAVARKAVELLRDAHGEANCASRPMSWSGSTPCKTRWTELPESESEFIGRQLALADRSRFLPQEYDSP
jgi:hypothetical protein